MQRSVFEGNITEAKLKSLKRELQKNIMPEEDSILIYSSEYLRYLGKENIGRMDDFSNVI